VVVALRYAVVPDFFHFSVFCVSPTRFAS
jgi:hypothetical protein